MELFVFVRMGSKHEGLVVKRLDADIDLAARLAKFNAGEAQCYVKEDKQRLWAVIEASFGTFEPFNKLVRAVFAKADAETAPYPQMEMQLEDTGHRHSTLPALSTHAS